MGSIKRPNNNFRDTTRYPWDRFQRLYDFASSKGMFSIKLKKKLKVNITKHETYVKHKSKQKLQCIRNSPLKFFSPHTSFSSLHRMICINPDKPSSFISQKRRSSFWGWYSNRLKRLAATAKPSYNDSNQADFPTSDTCQHFLLDRSCAACPSAGNNSSCITSCIVRAKSLCFVYI